MSEFPMLEEDYSIMYHASSNLGYSNGSVEPPLKTVNLTSMGSNVYTDGAVCNLNGTHPYGATMDANFIGKDQHQLPHFNSIMSGEDGQNSTTTSSGTTPPSSSSLVHSTTVAKAKDVAQVMDGAVNGYVKNCASMDHHHHHHHLPAGAGNIIRPESRLPDAAQLTSPQHHHHHPLLSQQHIHHQHHQHHHQQHYQPAASHHLQQQSLVSGGTIERLVAESGYHMDSTLFRNPGIGGSGGIGMPSHYHPHSLATSGSSAEAGNVGLDALPPSFSDGKGAGKRRSRKRPKTCGVCGDRAKSFHFGGLSCDSCKAFFRRSVQHDAHLAFRCAYDSCCDINISTRKSCQYCRFAKCLSIGMEKGWVMTEEERNALNQQRLEKKQNKSSTTSQQQAVQSPPSVPPAETATSSSASKTPPEPTYKFTGTPTPGSASSKDPPAALAFQESEYDADVDKMLDYMTYEEQCEIKSVVETYLHAYKEMPFRVSFEEGRRDTLEIIEMFTTILRRFAYFAKLIPDFSALSKGDQGSLLRAAVLEMCLLRGAVCFDTENNLWPSSTMESLKDCPQLRVEDMQRLVSRELFEMHITFIFHMKRLRIDEPTAMLLIMTVLFSPERIPVENKVKINQGQEKYLMLLKKYVNWKFGPAAGSRIYPQLLTKLSDLRQLNDFHTEFHLNLDRKEVNAIRQSLMELHLNPYPNWKIFPDSQQSSPEESRATSPVLPAPSPMVEGNPSMPMVTQALIRSFADRRIPALLENPYATFETDLGMIRQVQQTLGSLFPSSSLSFFSSQNPNTQPQQGTSTDCESTSSRNYSQHDPLFSSDKGPCSKSSSVGSHSQGYTSPNEPPEVQSLEFLQSSRSQEYQPPSLRDSSSSHLEGSLTTLLPGEYHSDRLQQFLQHRGSGSGFNAEGVIRGLGTGSTSSSSPTTPPSLRSSALISGSQQQTAPSTVLRKHSSSSMSSLLAAPLSVIRSGPAAKASTQSSSSLFMTSGVIQPLPDDSTVKDGEIGNDFQSIPCGTSSSAGWHGGKVQTTTNGHHPPTPASSSITVTSRIQSTTFSSSDDDVESSLKDSQ